MTNEQNDLIFRFAVIISRISKLHHFNSTAVLNSVLPVAYPFGAGCDWRIVKGEPILRLIALRKWTESHLRDAPNVNDRIRETR